MDQEFSNSYLRSSPDWFGSCVWSKVRAGRRLGQSEWRTETEMPGSRPQ